MSDQKTFPLSTTVRVIALAALYFFAGWFDQKHFWPFGNNSSWWPPSISFAALLILGIRFWPVVTAGLILFCLMNGASFDLSLATITIGNTFGAMLGVFLLKRPFRFNLNFVGWRDAAAYLIVAIIVVALFAALSANAQIFYAHPMNGKNLSSRLLASWIAAALSLLIISPFLIAWLKVSERRSPWQIFEAIFCAAGLVGGTFIAFGLWRQYDLQNYPFAYLPYPFLIWGALRFGVRGAATGTFLVSALAVYSVAQKTGPFFNGAANATFSLLDSYLAIIAISNLLLAAAGSERRRAQVELVESEKRLRAVVADQSDLICRFEPDGKMSFVNPAYEEFYGRSVAELIGSNFFDTLEKSEAKILRESLEAMLAENPVLNFDRRDESADGRGQWQQCNIRRLVRPGRDGFEFQAVIQDITPRKRAELAAQEARNEQEKINLQLQMAAAESRAAAELANRANSAKSDFLANMSHEIRTPLSGILGMIELLTQTRLDRRQKDLTSAATESANALLHVINDVLDFSKIEAGKMTLGREEFTLRAVVDGVLENASGREPFKRLALAAIIRREIPSRLIGDPIRLRQVLLNLVGNAIKFTERGEVIIRVQTQLKLPDKITLRFEVRDTGIGLTELEIKKLFKPFVQADNSSSRKFGGTGLGLAISRKLVELMGGKIGVQSVPRAGSTFWFELPFEIPAEPFVAHDFPGLAFLQVAVAAPNASLRESVVEQLRAQGVDARALGNFSELSLALQRNLQPAAIPLLICDEEMVAKGGEDLAKEIAASQVQCMLLASPTMTENENGPTLFPNILLKPVREKPLFEALINIVSRQKVELNLPTKAGDETEFSRLESAPKRTAISDLRILAAEDHPFNRKLCQLMLESFGARADWVVNGREAVEKISAGHYDAILMDCNMPEVDGHEATIAIRKWETENNAPRRVRIIALTANALVGERERCLAAGMDDYIAKPFTGQQLFDALASAIPMKNEQNFLDRARLAQMCKELDTGPVCDMIADFLKELPERVAELRRLNSEKNWPELERAAHSLKGLLGVFGVPPLAEIFREIEMTAEVADETKIQIALARLDAESPAALEQLQNWISDHRQPISPS